MAQQEGEEADDPMAWACQRFWKRRAAPLPLSRSLGRLRRCGWVVGAVGRQASKAIEHYLPGALAAPSAVSFTRTIALTFMPLCGPSPCSQSGLLSPAEERLPSSRYETDFTELRALGRGGYGVVVAGGHGCACLWLWVWQRAQQGT